MISAARKSSWRCALALALAGAVFGLRAQAVDCMPSEPPGFVTPRSGQHEAVTVFIHGLHGDGKATWTATRLGAAKAAWPCLLLADREIFAGTDAYLVSYRSEVGRSNPTIEEAARRIAADLTSEKIFEYRHVSFVVHSMGGIVLARMLTQPGLITVAQRQKIRLVVFVGTPALRTEAANICSKFGVNAQCLEMSNAEALDRLWKAWDELSPRPASWCVAEGADMAFLGFPPWLRIVPEDSAYRPCQARGQRTVAEGLDHSDVVKPLAITQRPHRDLRQAYAACVRPLLTRAASAAEVEANAQLAGAASNWLYRVKDSVVSAPDLEVEKLLEQLTPSANRYWLQSSTQPSFEFAAYEQLNGPSFVRATRIGFRAPSAEFQVQWVRQVSGVAEAVSDSAFAGLLTEMQAAGGLRPSDVVLALKARPADAGQTLFLLRPALSPGSPVGADAAPRPFGLLGQLLVPKPVERCVTAAGG